MHDNIGWDEKYPVRDMGNGKVRAVGMGMAMQGSGITSVDVGSASLKINDDGFYTLSIGAADMGTGCDTILAQIAAEVLECPLDNVTVLGADTDSSPYDSGSYASARPMSPARRLSSAPSSSSRRSVRSARAAGP